MAQLLEYLKMAVDNIKSNKGRSFLTMLGIIIGISSVILIVSIGNGAGKKVNSELEGLAGGQMYLTVNDLGLDNQNGITQEDIDAIKEQVDHLKGVAPVTGSDGTAYVKKGEFDAQFSAGTEDNTYLQQHTMIRGKYYTKSDVESAQKVGVINKSDALRLFGTVDVIGMELEVNVQGQSTIISIVGVMELEDSMFSYQYEGMPVTINIPYTTLEAITGTDVEPFQATYLIGESGKYSKEIIKETIDLLKARHQVTKDDVYIIQDFNDQMKSINQVISIMTMFIVFVAAISLLVGGIGVMNIMLVSVTERTREIGIRKALGAKTKSIMLQFLAESAIITLLGGIIGIVVGICGAYLVCAIPQVSDKGITPVLSVTSILIAVSFSSAIGLFFGIYPARKAAKMSPIEALRRE
ncbi:ABC transporter permease [Anaerosacchariphilus polymeriproducens]|uniref:Macrolide ABC transporter permease n=1 Tax=Anaerosacchariphilus polymeriproducens TaxID=1812858 RepID=A0A371AVI4_9FIRM|nr:ABC transporter permease [Anaerosacchariphilus polymeriproducens]RDU23595.1 macrolide ABC transporter permease [Anaerosacchariphilus polymeriproducens]